MSNAPSPPISVTEMLDRDMAINKDLEGPWNRLVNNYNELRKRAVVVKDKQYINYNAPAGTSILSTTEHTKSLKMEKQRDNRSLIEAEQSIIVFAGIGLTFMFIMSILVYKNPA